MAGSRQKSNTSFLLAANLGSALFSIAVWSAASVLPVTATWACDPVLLKKVTASTAKACFSVMSLLHGPRMANRLRQSGEDTKSDNPTKGEPALQTIL
jgi:hypothetical protein